MTSNPQQGWQFEGNLFIRIISMLNDKVSFSLKQMLLNFSIWILAAEMLPFKFRVYIPAPHQMCNGVIAGHAYTSVLSESCIRQASPGMLWRKQVSGYNDLSSSVAWPSWLLFLFVLFSQWLEMYNWVQREKKNTYKKKTMSSTEDRNHHLTSQTRLEVRQSVISGETNSCWCLPYSQRHK